MPSLLIITEIISPYRIPLFNTLAQDRHIDLHVIFLAETDSSLRQWNVYKDEIEFSYDVLPSWRRNVAGYNLLVNRRVARTLSKIFPDVILCGGYNYLASWQALLWAKLHRIPFLLWSESHLQELRADRTIVEFLKQEFLNRCEGFVVPGQSALQYLKIHNVAEDKIFIARNAVDNELFSNAATKARADRKATETELSLPARYFLFVGRLVQEKGVFELLAAYGKLEPKVRRDIGLVFVGDGPVRDRLQQQAAAVSPGTIKFAGFAQREELAKYYALAEVLVLPTYTDAWGLVVNEAMACGLPVILSRNAGCAADLVRENGNGFLIPSRDVSSLTSAMIKFANPSDLRPGMSSRSLKHIERYSAEEWCKGINQAVLAVTHE